MSTLSDFLLPVCARCNGSAIGPGLQSAIAFAKADMCNSVPEGSQAFQQPLFGCTNNVPLCVGAVCVPCCGAAVNAHNMTQITDRSCEDECLLSCVLQGLCCTYACYHASIRRELRKKYDVQGTPQMDCLMGLCCAQCMVCQEGVELQHGNPEYRIPMTSPEEAGMLSTFICPDFAKCNGGAISPGLETAIAFLKTGMCNSAVDGSKPFQQPLFGCMDNTPLCLGTVCVPCCGSAVNAHNMAQLTGRTCEDECLLSCVLQAACCFYSCYHASQRGELRKKYDLQGSPQMDCLLGLCCSQCMVCQEGAELQYAKPEYKIPLCSPSDAAATRASLDAKLSAKVEADAKAGGAGTAPAAVKAGAAEKEEAEVVQITEVTEVGRGETGPVGGSRSPLGSQAYLPPATVIYGDVVPL